LIPILSTAELAVDAIAAALTEEVQRRKRLTQYLLGQDALDDAFAPHVNVGLWRRIRSDSLWSLEIVVIVATSSAQGKSDGHPRSTPTGPPDALLVVESHRRHVRHHHGEKSADVDTRLHRCGDAQEINGIR
jgi:hypothetical protein